MYCTGSRNGATVLSSAGDGRQETSAARTVGPWYQAICAERSIRVWIGPRGEVAFNDAAVPMEEVGARLGAKLRTNPSLAIALYADARVPYGTVARVLDEVERAHAPRVTLTTEEAR